MNTLIDAGIDEGDWVKLPLAMRQRWWNETNYGKNAPSSELVAEVKAAIHAQQSAGRGDEIPSG